MNHESNRAGEPPLASGTIELRVRYQETDQMGVVYHGNYFTWFEMGRTELLRDASGISYSSLEKSTTMFAIVKAECQYKRPARYDDVLTLRTDLTRASGVTIEHEYRLFRGEELLAIGHTTLVSLDLNGRPRAVPKEIFPKRPDTQNNGETS